MTVRFSAHEPQLNKKAAAINVAAFLRDE